MCFNLTVLQVHVPTVKGLAIHEASLTRYTQQLATVPPPPDIRCCMVMWGCTSFCSYRTLESD